jgi:hypothetical protein
MTTTANPILTGYTNISSAPLSVNFYYFSKSITDLSNGGWTTTSIQDFENFLAAHVGLADIIGLGNFSTQLKPVQPYLSNALGTQFANLWQKMSPTLVANVAQQIETVGQQNHVTISNIYVVPPGSGSVWGQVGPGVLNVIYNLPGWNVLFDTPALDNAAWDVSFDVDLEITTDVPMQPFKLNFSAFAQPSNANLNMENTAALEIGLGDSVISAVTAGWVPNIFSTVSGDVDNNTPAVDVSTLNSTLATTLNNASTPLAAAGFTTCAFSIVGNPPQLTLTLTHPHDPAPALQNANASGGTLSIPPWLATSESEVKPGAAMAVFGHNFPVDTMSQLTVQWPNTSSGTPTGANIKYRLKGNSASEQTEPVSWAGPLYYFTATSLTANTTYEFVAQCGDFITWSEWGTVWFEITTSSTNIATVVLATSPTGSGVTVGSAPLPETAAPWNCAVQIPNGTAPGTYYLLAELSGNVLAWAQIVVAESLSPILQMIDTSTTPPTIITDPELDNGTTFTVRGEDFSPNSIVTVSLNGVAAVTTITPTGEFVVPITLPGNANTGGNTYTVTATTDSGQSASLPPFTTISPPK